MLRGFIEAPIKTVEWSEGLGQVVPRNHTDRTVVLFNGNRNYSTDIQGLLESTRPNLVWTPHVVAGIYHSYFVRLYRLVDSTRSARRSRIHHI